MSRPCARPVCNRPVPDSADEPFCHVCWLGLRYNTRLRLLDYSNHSADGYLVVLTLALHELSVAA